MHDAGEGPKEIRGRSSEPLAGEDIATSHWEDARHWIGVYSDLLRFKVGLLERVRRGVARLRPVAQQAAETDLAIISDQMEGYQRRLALWFRRLLELQGLRLDPEDSMIRHHGREARLSKREFQLLQFLLEHPHRFFTASQLLARAWSDPALFPEEMRNYIRRLRKILADLEIPCDIINRPGRGYLIEFRDEK